MARDLQLIRYHRTARTRGNLQEVYPMKAAAVLILTMFAGSAIAHPGHGEAHIHGAAFVLAFIAISMVVAAIVQLINGTR